MKALVKKKNEVGLWLDDVPVPKGGINDIFIEILQTGICGADQAADQTRSEKTEIAEKAF